MQKGMSLRVVPPNTCVSLLCACDLITFKLEPLAERNGVIFTGHRNIDDGLS